MANRPAGLLACLRREAGDPSRPGGDAAARAVGTRWLSRSQSVIGPASRVEPTWNCRGKPPLGQACPAGSGHGRSQRLAGLRCHRLWARYRVQAVTQNEVLFFGLAPLWLGAIFSKSSERLATVAGTIKLS